jgi:putative ABC transport system permease protein
VVAAVADEDHGDFSVNMLEVLRIAIESLLRHKTRALLTMLGIIIGVAAVIAMLAIGRGAQSAIEAQIASLGTNVLLIFPGATASGGVSSGAGTSVTLTVEDAEAIREQASAVSYVTPTVRTVRQVVAGNLNWSSTIQGGTIDFLIIRGWKLNDGELFTEQDIRGGTKVCLLGKTVVDNLFPNMDPIGQTIRIHKIPFQVVGTLEPKGQNMMGQDQDDIIIAPFSTVQRKVMGSDHIGAILVSARDKASISAAQQQVTSIIRNRHRLQEWEDNDFTVRNQSDLASAATATTGIMTALLGSIASVSLLVGGIGIMNIMLVSVTERTREIGIRMSLGARRRDILQQFLIESIMLSIIGGLIGIGLGIGIASIIESFSGWAINVTPESVGMSFAFSAAVGMFFGFYPARKAARLSPIEALRYE